MDSKLKILIISDLYPSPSNKMTFFVHDQVKALVNQKCEVKVISPLPWIPFWMKSFAPWGWQKRYGIPLKTNLDGIEIYYPRYLEIPRALFFSTGGLRMYWGIKNTVAQIYKDFKFDIIHSHVAFPAGYTSMQLAAKYGKPFLVTIHGQDFYSTVDMGNTCKKVLERVIKHSWKTIAVSTKLKEVGERKLEIEPGKIVVIGNGMNKIEDSRRLGGYLRQACGEKKIILSVSALIKRKAIDHNIRAVAALRQSFEDFVYVVVGDGPEKKRLMDLAKELKICDAVMFLGELSHNQALECIHDCDIFSLPSVNESFGVVYLEAMAFAKPVIACVGEGIDGIVRDGKTGLLVKYGDVESLSGKMLFLLKHPDKAKELGQNAKKEAEKHTWENIASDIIKIYREAVKKSNII